ncbi:lactate utilization protein C [Paenibacillus puldeungensis]|uniref:Lactate utilization protein C n=1 Tax=Paenibacillus puldeungensis TaxID=696536 RepID=A0ABW3RXF0_9BACL
MTISNREAFLDNIAAKLGRERKRDVKRPAWIHHVHQETLQGKTTEELIDIFKKQCALIHTEVIESTPEALQKTLDGLIDAYGGGPIIRSGDQRFTEYDLTFTGDSYIWQETAGREENIRRAASANTAIVFADYALAESGTIVVESRPDQGRSLHFLPTHYIAIIEKKRIVPRSTQAAADLNRRIEAGEPIGSCINLISGPSNSADIEMQLVVGVHGPLQATYVLI